MVCVLNLNKPVFKTFFQRKEKKEVLALITENVVSPFVTIATTGGKNMFGEEHELWTC